MESVDGAIVVFRFPSDMSASAKNRFCQLFYGQDTTTWKGRYSYHRHGLLDDIPHRRLGRSVVIIRIEDEGKVERFLRDHLNEFHIRKIVLTAEDRKLLNASSQKTGKELNSRK